MAQSALGPLRSAGQVWVALRRRPGPMLAWWGGGTLAGALLAGAVALADPAEEQQGWLLLGGLLALLLTGIVWRVGLARELEAALEPEVRACSGASLAGRILGVGATLVALALILLGVSLPFAAALAWLASCAGSGALLRAALLGSWLAVVVPVALGLSLAPFAAAVEPAGPGTLLLRSWRLVRGRRLALAGFWLATVVLACSGLLVFGVGILVSGALLHLLPTEAWLALRREARGAATTVAE